MNIEKYKGRANLGYLIFTFGLMTAIGIGYYYYSTGSKNAGLEGCNTSRSAEFNRAEATRLSEVGTRVIEVGGKEEIIFIAPEVQIDPCLSLTPVYPDLSKPTVTMIPLK